ncbi:MAG: cell division ATP-binding protein FtsE [Patescibacteria group bacterium]
MIVFKNVTKIFSPNIVALDNISFEIKSGEFVLIIGKSGAGKSTVLKLINKQLEPTKGDIFYKNVKITNISSKKKRELRRKITTIYQDFKLLFKKTVFENLALALEIWGKSEKEIEKEVLFIAEKLKIKDKLNQKAETLSGGEMQKVCLARSLLFKPEVILADEPTGNLDPLSSLEIIEILKDLNKEGITIILATHNKEIVNSLKTRVLTLENGRLISDKNPGNYSLG